MVFKGVVPTRKPLIIPVFIPHIGCPNRCAFCNQRAVTGVKKVSVDDVERSVREYLGWSRKRTRTELSFYGGTFTALPQEYFDKMVRKGFELVESGMVDALRCSTRPDAVNEEKAKRLADSGFETVELGVQTFSQSLLERMRRGHSFDAAQKAFEILKKSRLSVGFQFITGYPGETESEFEETLMSLDKSSPDFIRIYPFVPLPETDVSREIEAGRSELQPVAQVIERSARVFVAAQRKGIPVIRIGLPQATDVPKIYPENLSQVVIAKALGMVWASGEKILIPQVWKSQYNMAKKAGEIGNEVEFYVPDSDEQEVGKAVLLK